MPPRSNKVWKKSHEILKQNILNFCNFWIMDENPDVLKAPLDPDLEADQTFVITYL